MTLKKTKTTETRGPSEGGIQEGDKMTTAVRVGCALVAIPQLRGGGGGTGGFRLARQSLDGYERERSTVHRVMCTEQRRTRLMDTRRRRSVPAQHWFWYIGFGCDRWGQSGLKGFGGGAD